MTPQALTSPPGRACCQSVGLLHAGSSAVDQGRSGPGSLLTPEGLGLEAGEGSLPLSAWFPEQLQAALLAFIPVMGGAGDKASKASAKAPLKARLSCQLFVLLD